MFNNAGAEAERAVESVLPDSVPSVLSDIVTPLSNILAADSSVATVSEAASDLPSRGYIIGEENKAEISLQQLRQQSDCRLKL